jgi:hypothetical protein
MAIHFNHTILLAHDGKASATFLAEILGLPAPRKWGPFHMVTTANDANLDDMDSKGEIVPQHYAFLVGDAEFDEHCEAGIRARPVKTLHSQKSAW